MLRRVGLWTLCGFGVALIWAAIFYIVGPSNGSYPSQGAVLRYLSHSAILQITAPVALLGNHHAITWYWSTVINAVIYACLGLGFETIRLAVRFGSGRLHY